MTRAVVRAVVDSRLRLRGLPPNLAYDMERAFFYRNPKHTQLTRIGRSTRGVPKRLSMVRRERTGVSLPRATVETVRQVLEANGLSLEVADRRTEGEPLQVVRLGFTLRGYQREAVDELETNGGGVVVASCGSGKTIMGLAAVARFGRSALVVVHTHDLAEQWRTRVRDGLGVEAGAIAGGRFEVRPVTVALVQSLARLDEPRLRSLGRRFGTIVLDEAHHAPASTFGQVLDSLDGRYRIGLSATPRRADGLEPVMFATLGPVVFRLDQAELVRLGHLVRAEVCPIATQCNPKTFDYAELVSELIADPDRNALVVEVARRCAAKGRTVLLLTGRIDHAERLAGTLTDAGVAAGCLTGRTRKADRGPLLDRLRSGDLQVLVATQLADEGLDVPRLERVVLATPSKASGRVTQRLGRLLRPCAGKVAPVLFDLVDDLHPITRKQWRARREAYESAGAVVYEMRSLAPHRRALSRKRS